MENKQLTGKVTLITGAAQGIGKTIASVFAEEGSTVVVSDIREDEGDVTVREINDAGGSAAFVKADLRNEQEIESMVGLTAEKYGRLDVLINNARPRLVKTEYAESLDEWDLAMDIFLKAPALATKYAAPLLKRTGGGSIINIASVNAFTIASHQPASYHVAKAGLVQLTRYLAAEYGADDIRVNAVCPGLVDMGEKKLTDDPVNKAVAETVVPLKRASVPEDIARTVVFLCSDAARYITGQALIIDGGETIMDTFHVARNAYNLEKE